MKSLLSPPEQARLIGRFLSLGLSCLVFTKLLTQKCTRQRLGYRADKNAEYLMPVPSESVVYGSGETAVVLSKVHFAHESLRHSVCC